jgi:hypothetical protein
MSKEIRETCPEVVNALSCLRTQYRDVPLGYMKARNLLNAWIASKSSKKCLHE